MFIIYNLLNRNLILKLDYSILMFMYIFFYVYLGKILVIIKENNVFILILIKIKKVVFNLIDFSG